ncbi:MAG TPA: alpha/beta hydrolase [Thermoleophilaceae bacterium]|jgi:pimeloyl-ACP methyl ester carboxylesterase
MAEQFCRVSPTIELCYETFGSDADPPALLVMGLGVQMISWHEDFCRELADRGFHVVRFDNRDAGRSTHVPGPPPTLGQLVRRSRRAAHYLVSDMARDAAGLLRELDLAPAHVIGPSMGGMIAQTMAARHPECVRSLTSIMSTTGGRLVGQPSPLLYPVLVRRPRKGKEAFVEHWVRIFRTIGSRGLEQDVDHFRDVAERGYERDHDPRAAGRQLAAIIASGDRTAELRRIAVPTLVIHGTDDRLVLPSGGRATAKAIPGARLLMIEGMGHDLPRAAWPRMLDAIVENAARADDAVPAAA